MRIEFEFAMLFPRWLAVPETPKGYIILGELSVDAIKYWFIIIPHIQIFYYFEEAQVHLYKKGT